MIRAAWKRWDRFWFAPTDPIVLGLIRICVGVLMTLWALTLFGQLADFFAADGVAGSAPAERPWYAWTLLGAAPAPLPLATVYLALLIAAPALALGWHSRVASIVVLLATVSLQRTNPYVFNSGDSLLRLLCLYVAIAPSGAALSLDARRRGPRMIPAWPLRLIQLQVSVMYLAAVWAKLRGPAWRDGTAAEYALRLPDLERFPAGAIFDSLPAAAAVATYGTLAIEASLVVLVWPRRTRLYALLAGAALHIAIDLTLRVGFFTLAVLVTYLAFLDPAWARKAAARVSAVARTPRRVPRPGSHALHARGHFELPGHPEPPLARDGLGTRDTDREFRPGSQPKPADAAEKVDAHRAIGHGARAGASETIPP